MTTTVHLYFRKGQAKVLANIRDQLIGDGGSKAAIETFDMASRAAKAGQPMTVQSNAEQIADGIASLGAARPRIVMKPPV